jgi:ATP-dependent exoDNAse (exonuclease V) beta subunit
MKSTIKFYNASAGSGKTFTLARDILVLLFKNHRHKIYRNILAVTFTNKAVAEMKSRVLDYLFTISQGVEQEESLDALLQHISLESGLEINTLPEIAQQIHKRILHDYSAFDIVTIDAFNHRLLQTFSRDLGLQEGFEVDLDVQGLFTKAIRSLLKKVGKDKELTRQVVQFSISKIDQDKSWDIGFDLLQIAQLISSENDFTRLQEIKQMNLDDFVRFRESVKHKATLTEEKLSQEAKTLLYDLGEAGIVAKDFNQGTRGPYGVIEKIASGNFSASPETASVQKLQNGDFYKKSSSPSITSSMAGFEHRITSFANEYVEAFYSLDLYNNALSNLNSLSLINSLLKEIEQIKQEEHILPIYEFNGLIAKEIKNQPAPFIYERMGERYKHYFIDEFQDTSTMQWQNLGPLISNALSQDTGEGDKGSLMLVGDAKQAIYRWRGGNADQFLDVFSSKDLLFASKVNKTLSANWRSFDNIVQFNNDFFGFYGSKLNDLNYKDLYLNQLKQESRGKGSGYIQIDFLDEMEVVIDDESVNSQIDHVFLIAQQALQNGYLPSEVSILTRTNAQGRDIAQYLNTKGLKVISGDSLMVSESKDVQLLVAMLELGSRPKDKKLKFEFLMAYHTYNNLREEVFNWISVHMKMNAKEIFKALFGEQFSKSIHQYLPVYEIVHRCTVALNIYAEPDNRFGAFMDYVHEFSLQSENTVEDFLSQWESKCETLAVPTSPVEDALTLMTIHKSKGLEFPVVIVPFCDKGLSASKTERGWLPVDPQLFGFSHLYINIKNSVQFYSSEGEKLYSTHVNKTQMDHINTLYVAFTRAREQLFIIAEDPALKKTGQIRQSDLLHEFALQRGLAKVNIENGTRYKLGLCDRESELLSGEKSIELKWEQPPEKQSKAVISTRKGVLWSTEIDESINVGNIIHHYLSKVIGYKDVDSVLLEMGENVALNKGDQHTIAETIENIVNHPKLKEYFSNNYRIYTETAILSPDGTRIIPDRVMINGSSLIILDYKTGKALSSHRIQLDLYADIFKAMDYVIHKKILVYTDEMSIVEW